MNRGERSMTRGGRRIEAAIRHGLALVLTLLAALAPLPAFAHDIPADVRIQAFVKPEGQHLYVLLRVPLGAMNEVDMPLRGAGYLDLARADPALRVAAELWFADNLSLFEDDRPLPRPTLAMARVSLASDRSFASWEEAIAHLRAPPIPPQTELYWKAQHFDLLLELPISSERSRFSIEPRLARMGLKVVTTLRYLPPGGAERAYEFHGNPGRVHLDPRWHQAALRFVDRRLPSTSSTASDHLLFIALPGRPVPPPAAPRRRRHRVHRGPLDRRRPRRSPGLAPQRPLVPAAGRAADRRCRSSAMALENLVGARPERRCAGSPPSPSASCTASASAFALQRDRLQFAGSHLATALLAFNVGVELGQLAVLVVLVPALNALRRVVPERTMVIVLSVLVAHTGWHWMSERWATLRQFPGPRWTRVRSPAACAG